ncbi:adenylate cyclase type 10-like, partial [Uloborus diversus]|uniref:adenylate cyclase type 10-like n=1 Tax=Uloborus diversus TaxID=327109 RepID=UPI00240A6A45
MSESQRDLANKYAETTRQKRSFWGWLSGKSNEHKDSRAKVLQAEKELRRISSGLEEDKQDAIPAKYLPLTFVPDFIIEEILNDSFRNLPYMVSSNSVLLLADVSGFTKLTESFCEKGVAGVEELVSVLNGYMGTLASMLIASGGDILNFAGDAFLVQWQQNDDENISDTVGRAYHCAIALQTHQSLKEKDLNGKLRVKVVLAVGEIMTWVLGSPSEFLLYVLAGQPLPKVQRAESLCSAGQIVVTEKVFRYLQEVKAPLFTHSEVFHGFFKITNLTMLIYRDECIPNRIKKFQLCDQQHISMAKAFLIPGIRGIKTGTELNYLSEMTMVTTVFVVLLNVDIEEPTPLERTFDITLSSAKKFGGILNKMFLFDKGCTFLIAFGLPMLKHSNDAARGILCSKDIVDKLKAIDITSSVGITTGTCFCGIVGHPQRQEYTVMGRRVNMAARLMMVYNDEPIVMDAETFHLSRDELVEGNFFELPARKMKGIESAGAIYGYEFKTARKGSLVDYDTLLVEDFQSRDNEQGKVREILEALKEASRIPRHTESLLPVIIIEGPTGSGKSYLMHYALETADSMGYKAICCCAIASQAEEPFSVVARLAQRMLGFTFNKSSEERMCRLRQLFDGNEQDLHYINHLFEVSFPSPKLSCSVKPQIDHKFVHILKTIIKKACSDKYTLIAVNNVDFMDESSWLVLQGLAEESNNFTFLFSLSFDFQKPWIVASAFLLKASAHINMEATGEDYFISTVCWMLNIKAFNKSLFSYLYQNTQGNTQLLGEMLLSPSFANHVIYIPLKDIPEKKRTSFYIHQLDMHQGDQDTWIACDLKPGVSLMDIVIPNSINDVMKERLNNLTIQDRLVLKRAAVLGYDFDQQTLRVVNSKLDKKEITESINRLIHNYILSSACLQSEKPEKKSLLSLRPRDKCLCYSIHREIEDEATTDEEFKTGPYHRLKFRTAIFKNYILQNMTQEQVYTMHVEMADALELKSDCFFCQDKKGKKTSVTTDVIQSLNRYPIQLDETNCLCLQRRANTLTQISRLYTDIGVKLLPVYFTRRAAEAALDIDHAFQALFYLKRAEEMFPVYWSEEDHQEEIHFEPLVMKASLKKTTANAFLQIGDVYWGATCVFQMLEMFGLNA